LIRSVSRLLRSLREGGHPSTFIYTSVVNAPVSEAFGWHERPEALSALTPAMLVRIEQQRGGIRDGGMVTVSIGAGPARLRWTMRHYGYVHDRQFCDEQVRGPFVSWRHTHRFEPIGPSQTLYRDHIEFTVSRGRTLNWLLTLLMRPVLLLLFAQRHRIVRTRLARRGPSHKYSWIAILLALGSAGTLQLSLLRAQTSAPVRTVAFVDLDRYSGEWFEIARYANRFQRQCVGDVRADYVKRSDGRLDVVNQCRSAEGNVEARGIARIVDTGTGAKLKVRFAPAWLSFVPYVWGDYWVIGLGDDYSWAVVGSPDRKYLWILARKPQLDDLRARAARAAATDNGFDVGRLVPTLHTKQASQ
jgi:apolipoprotein D and lipocalin family protein